MNESVYHVYANYCGARKLLFAGYASRVARRLRMQPSALAVWASEEISIQIAPTTDRYGNRMPYQLWTGPVMLYRITNPEMEITA